MIQPSNNPIWVASSLQGTRRSGVCNQPMTLHPRDGNDIAVKQPLPRPSAANTGTATTAVSSMRPATGHLSSVFAETVPVIVLNVTV